MDPGQLGPEEWRQRIGEEYVRIAEALRRYALYLTGGDEDWADEILSNAWFAVIDPPERPMSFRGWLRRVIYCEWAADCRRTNRAPRFASFDEAEAAADAPPDEPLIVEERPAALLRLIEQLLRDAPPQYHHYLTAVRELGGGATAEAIAQRVTALRGKETSAADIGSLRQRYRRWLQENGYDVTGYGIVISWCAWDAGRASAQCLTVSAQQGKPTTGSYTLEPWRHPAVEAFFRLPTKMTSIDLWKAARLDNERGEAASLIANHYLLPFLMNDPAEGTALKALGECGKWSAAYGIPEHVGRLFREVRRQMKKPFTGIVRWSQIRYRVEDLREVGSSIISQRVPVEHRAECLKKWERFAGACTKYHRSKAALYVDPPSAVAQDEQERDRAYKDVWFTLCHDQTSGVTRYTSPDYLAVCLQRLRVGQVDG